MIDLVWIVSKSTRLWFWGKPQQKDTEGTFDRPRWYPPIPTGCAKPRYQQWIALDVADWCNLEFPRVRRSQLERQSGQRPCWKTHSILHQPKCCNQPKISCNKFGTKFLQGRATAQQLVAETIDQLWQTIPSTWCFVHLRIFRVTNVYDLNSIEPFGQHRVESLKCVYIVDLGICKAHRMKQNAQDTECTMHPSPLPQEIYLLVSYITITTILSYTYGVLWSSYGW